MATLIEADPRALSKRDELTFEEWHGGLSRPQFLEREIQLRSTPWARQNMKTWFLVDQAGNILSSCESFRQDSEWEGRKGNTYALASVFTEKDLRGKGFATQMIQMLAERIRRSDPLAHSVILFSDVGESIYERAGFLAVEAWDRVLSVTEKVETPGNVKVLGRNEIHSKLFRQQAIRGEFLVRVSPGQVDWRIERQGIYARRLGFREPEHCCAVTPSGLAIWVALYNIQALKVLVFEAREPSEADALISAMNREAAIAGLKNIVIWETPEFSDWDRLTHPTRRVLRDGSLPMIHPLIKDLSPVNWKSVPNGLWV